MKAILTSTKVLMDFAAGDKLNLLNNSSGHAAITIQKKTSWIQKAKIINFPNDIRLKYLRSINALLRLNDKKKKNCNSGKFK